VADCGKTRGKNGDVFSLSDDVLLPYSSSTAPMAHFNGGYRMQNQSVGPLLRLSSVEAMVGLKKSEIYRRIKLGTFPQPIKLGLRAVAWPTAAVDAWVKSLIQKGAK
jgi:prophage regulatory protein